jgi:hypothetical protein
MNWSTTSRRSARSGRQQRGDLKSVVGVAGLDKDAHHVLLELSDVSEIPNYKYIFDLHMANY